MDLKKGIITKAEIKDFFNFNFENDEDYFSALKKICLYEKTKKEDEYEIYKIYTKDEDNDNLTCGFWTNKELAKWFNVKDKTIQDKRRKYLDKLASYADFCGGRKGVYIYNVREDIFCKNRNYKKIKEHYQEEWPIRENKKIGTHREVAEKCYEKYHLNCKITTATKYVCEARKEDYGKILPLKEISPWDRKKCAYVWMVEEEDGEIRFLTEEEEILRKKLNEAYYKGLDLMDIAALIEEGELDKEEAWIFLRTESLKSFHDLLREFWNITSLRLRKMTYLID